MTADSLVAFREISPPKRPTVMSNCRFVGSPAIPIDCVEWSRDWLDEIEVIFAVSLAWRKFPFDFWKRNLSTWSGLADFIGCLTNAHVSSLNRNWIFRLIRKTSVGYSFCQRYLKGANRFCRLQHKFGYIKFVFLINWTSRQIKNGQIECWWSW